MIGLENISLAFGDQVIFDNVSANISPDQKIGLVGRNGSGKTTLLNVIAGQQPLDSGQVNIPKSFNCAFMPQDVVLVSKKTIINETLSAFSHISKLTDELELLEQKIKLNDGSEKLHERYSDIHHQLYELNYESKKAEVEQMLAGLGFVQEQLNNQVDTLSVGWKMRLVLAKLLLQKADFYLFDEPINHLDIFAKDWFVEFLKNANFGFILVAHDEYFLNTVCTSITEISRGKLTSYNGGYYEYMRQKEANEVLLEKKYEEQQKLIKKTQATIDRFRYKASKARMAQSMMKNLEKIERVELAHTQRTVKFSLPSVQRSGKVVLDVKNLSFAFGRKKIFDNVSFQLTRGKKAAIVASNGMGKSTLLNVIMGKYKQDIGIVSFGHNVQSAFFEQDQNKSLNKNNEILQEVEQSCQTLEQRSRVRGALGAFLFSGDDVYKKIKVLSGGEKNRVAMVKVLLQNANFLILDEPTNHLDIVSKNILLDVLSTFEGTILFVSHDRTFLNGLATDILELTPYGIETYEGNYDDYLYYKKERGVDTVNAAKDQVKQKEKMQEDTEHQRVLKKKIRNVESAIKKLENEVTLAEERFATLAYGTPEYETHHATWEAKKRDLQDKYDLWENLMKDIEG